jgi:hypothetical protein
VNQAQLGLNGFDDTPNIKPSSFCQVDREGRKILRKEEKQVWGSEIRDASIRKMVKEGNRDEWTFRKGNRVYRVDKNNIIVRV